VIVDAHNDLLSEVAFRRAEPQPFERHWRDQLRAGRVGLQICPIYVRRDRICVGALEEALQQAAAFHRAIHENDDVVCVMTRDDVAGLDPQSRLGLMLSLEGVDPFAENLGLVDVFYELGVRMAALTWNDANAAAGGAGGDAAQGVSDFGREVVRRFVELGVVLDVAHASEQTLSDVIDLADGRPVVVSHTGCRTVYATPRNLTDDQLRRVARTGGVIGIMAHPLAVDPAMPTLERYLDHIDHAVSVVGVDHVGLGPDFIEQVARSGASGDPGNLLLPPGVKLEDSIAGLAGPADLPALLDALARRGHPPAAIEAIAAGNVLRVLGDVLPRRA
jgi:membrane dipeptidase